MTDTQGTVFCRRWFDEIWNRGNVDLLDEMLAPDCVAHGMAGADGEPPTGPEGFRAVVLGIRAAFPDIHISVEDALSDEDTVACRCIVRGTHLGSWMGIPASGRPVEIGGMSFVTVQDGRMTAAWNQFDFASLVQQISA